MSKAPPPRGGVAGLALLFCLTALGVGLAFDFSARAPGGFWIGAQPGASAIIGAGAAIACALVARLAHLVFGKRDGDV
ncbi:MAG TPA: hypothetical protein VEA80_16920 [Vitreimonas sp.]|uniref:hypothetical protein n=1 Tax=Vitreimonas sp. TaxID=3069702 RepID=UPI002D606FF2|nr:hypothetical protein [Vitreimonas sp.]HYD89163.1 hypothetical protein [Vitreimonas sp.]